MTIHDILSNCGSVNTKTYVAIANITSWTVLWQGLYEDLPIREEYKLFNFFTIGWYFCEETNSNQAYFRFYV